MGSNPQHDESFDWKEAEGISTAMSTIVSVPEQVPNKKLPTTCATRSDGIVWTRCSVRCSRQLHKMFVAQVDELNTLNDHIPLRHLESSYAFSGRGGKSEFRIWPGSILSKLCGCVPLWTRCVQELSL